MISLSIISHGQYDLVKNLLDSLEKYCSGNTHIEVILTINIPENLPENFADYHFPIRLIKNQTPKGFGANHNSAFQLITQPYFCVLNPDIVFVENSFPKLIEDLNNSKIGVSAPAIINPQGKIQDSAREFLTPLKLFKRFFGDNKPKNMTQHPDWIAGMFMLFRKEVYQEIHGFDERYYLYCEDMDLCARFREKSYQVYYNNTVKVIHQAQRQSHKNLRYLIWHLQSLLRYFYRYYFNPSYLGEHKI